MSSKRPIILSYSSLVIGVGVFLYATHVSFQPYLFVCGAVMLGLGVSLLYGQAGMFLNTRKTHGKLVGWSENNASPNPNYAKIYYYADVVFEDNEGVEHHVRSATGSRPKPKTPIGHRMPVRYDPSNPENARLDTIFDFWGPSCIITLFGAVLLFLAFKVAH